LHPEGQLTVITLTVLIAILVSAGSVVALLFRRMTGRKQQ
jgi:hypothetical protein